MKNRFKLFWLIAATVIIGIVLTACEEETTKCTHTFVDGAVITAVTCTTDGLVKQVCSKCDAEGEDKTVVKLGHDWETDEAKWEVTVANCTEGGGTKIFCTRILNSVPCNEYKIEGEGAALGHGERTKVNEVLPTFFVDGYSEWKCVNCDDKEIGTAGLEAGFKAHGNSIVDRNDPYWKWKNLDLSEGTSDKWSFWPGEQRENAIVAGAPTHPVRDGVKEWGIGNHSVKIIPNLNMYSDCAWEFYGTNKPAAVLSPGEAVGDHRDVVGRKFVLSGWFYLKGPNVSNGPKIQIVTLKTGEWKVFQQGLPLNAPINQWVQIVTPVYTAAVGDDEFVMSIECGPGVVDAYATDLQIWEILP